MGLSNCFPSLPVSKLKYPIYIYIATYSNTARWGQPWVYNVSWWLLYWLFVPIRLSALIRSPRLKLMAFGLSSWPKVKSVTLEQIEQLYISKLMCD